MDTLLPLNAVTVCSGCGRTASSYRDRRIHRVRDLDAGANHIYLEFEYRRVACPQCKAVKRETLCMLAKSARFTQRFEDRIGQLCREMSIKRVAELNNLSWDQVCRMEKCYMRRLLVQHPPSEHLRSIGVDEISVRKGHTYAIVVADLDQRRPIWLGDRDAPNRICTCFLTPWVLNAAKTLNWRLWICGSHFVKQR